MTIVSTSVSGWSSIVSASNSASDSDYDSASDSDRDSASDSVSDSDFESAGAGVAESTRPPAKSMES